MCERGYVLRHYIAIMVGMNKLDEDDNLTAPQWDDIYTIVKILEPFMLAQRTLEGEKYVTNSLIPSIIWHIRKQLEADCADEAPHSDSIKALVKLLLVSFNANWGSGLDGTVFHEQPQEGHGRRHVGIPTLTLLAAKVDPRTTDSPGKGGIEDVLALDQLLLERMLEVARELREVAIDQQPERPQRVTAGDRFDDVFNTVLHPQQPDERIPHNVLMVPTASTWERHTKEVLAAELLLFNTEPRLAARLTGADGVRYHSNPLSWWKSHQKKFPHIAVLARQWLCVPATSAPSERVFSAAGLTIARDRARLTPHNAEALIFLHKVWPVVDNWRAQRARLAAKRVREDRDYLPDHMLGNRG
jgi:hypothetical protein